MQVVVVVSDQLAMLSCISPALRAAVGERMKAVSVELSKVAVGEPESWWVYLRRFLQVGVQQPLAGDSTAAMLSVVLKVMEWSCQLCNRVGPATGLANRLCQVYLEAIRADADAGRAGRALLLRIGPFALLVKHSDCLLWGSFMRTLVSYCKRKSVPRQHHHLGLSACASSVPCKPLGRQSTTKTHTQVFACEQVKHCVSIPSCKTTWSS